MTEAEAIADLERQIEESGTSLNDRSGSAEIAAHTFASRAEDAARVAMMTTTKQSGDDEPEPTGRVITWIILCAMIGAGVFVVWAATWWTP